MLQEGPVPSAPCTDGGGTRSECRDTDSEVGLRDTLDQEDGANASDGWVPLQARWKRPERCGQEDMEQHTSPEGRGLLVLSWGAQKYVVGEITWCPKMKSLERMK